MCAELEKINDREVGQLSGGELQRFAIAMCAVQEADMWESFLILHFLKLMHFVGFWAKTKSRAEAKSARLVLKTTARRHISVQLPRAVHNEFKFYFSLNFFNPTPFLFQIHVWWAFKLPGHQATVECGEGHPVPAVPGEVCRGGGAWSGCPGFPLRLHLLSVRQPRGVRCGHDAYESSRRC